MDYVDPHVHMVSRTTDDYKRMALAGCVMVGEPAFWAGFDRSGPEGFYDYFRQLTEVEPRRAADHGIAHRSWLCINAKEAEDVSLAREVIKLIPEFLDRPGVLGIGEIGLNKNTRNEATVFQEHLDLAARTDELILIHTPHLADKYQGTRMILDMVQATMPQDPARIACASTTSRSTPSATSLDAGHWVGHDPLSRPPSARPQRAADLVEQYGTDRILVNSAGDWGSSDPLAVPEFIFEMRGRGHAESLIRRLVHDNPLAFFGQCRRFVHAPRPA